MKKFLSLLLLLAPAVALAQDLPQWLDVSASTAANAEKAKAGNIGATEATQAIIRSGDPAPETVGAIVTAYETCDALMQSVRAAAELAPNDAQKIVDAALEVEGCPCSNAQVWERSRLEKRIRVQRRAEPTTIAAGCECAATVAGAVAAALGSRGYGLVQSSLVGNGSCDCAPAAFAATANALPDGTAWIRDQTRALAAEATDGGPVLDMIGEVAPPQAEQGALDALPAPLVRSELSCTAVEGQDKRFLRICTAANRFPLLIGRYVTENGKRGLELVNVGTEKIDLDAEHLVIDVFAEGENRASRSIPLTGTLEPNARLVVSTPETPAGLAEPDIRSGELSKGSIDAVAVRRQMPEDDTGLACSAAALAMAEANPEGPIIIGAAPTVPLEGDPRTDESPIDPDRGGDIASPN